MPAPVQEAPAVPVPGKAVESSVRDDGKPGKLPLVVVTKASSLPGLVTARMDGRPPTDRYPKSEFAAPTLQGPDELFCFCSNGTERVFKNISALRNHLKAKPGCNERFNVYELDDFYGTGVMVAAGEKVEVTPLVKYPEWDNTAYGYYTVEGGLKGFLPNDLVQDGMARTDCLLINFFSPDPDSGAVYCFELEDVNRWTYKDAGKTVTVIPVVLNQRGAGRRWLVKNPPILEVFMSLP
jgi:hypothetical protein